MVYMFNGGELPGIDLGAKLTLKESFRQAVSAKKSYTVDNLCVDGAKCLKQFAKQVLLLRYKDKPDYASLQSTLLAEFDSIMTEANHGFLID